MRHILLATALAFCSLAFSTPSSAAEPATCTWNCSWDFRNAAEKQVGTNTAVTVLQGRSGGFGPAVYNSTTTYNDEVTYNQDYDGAVTQTGATNLINSSQTNNTVNAEDSTVTLSVSTDQGSVTATQDADSTVSVESLSHSDGDTTINNHQ